MYILADRLMGMDDDFDGATNDIIDGFLFIEGKDGMLSSCMTFLNEEELRGLFSV